MTRRQENINNLSFSNCSHCKKMLVASKLMFTKYWRCDNCILIDLKKRLNEESPERGFLNELFAEKIVEGWREQTNKNGSLSLDELDFLENSVNSK